MSDNGDNNKPPVSALQDLIAGGIAGSVSVIVGHPFDTYKVRLQVSAAGTKPAISISNIGTLFRGIGAPLSTAAIVNALIFSSYGESSRLYDDFLTKTYGGNLNEIRGGNVGNNNNDDEVAHPSSSSPHLKPFICGSVAGAVQALVVCPTEHIKCRLQTQHTAGYKDATKFKGSLDALDKILNSHGIRGLYRGFVCTAWREVPAFGFYFTTYDFIKDAANNLISPSQESSTANSNMDGTVSSAVGDTTDNNGASNYNNLRFWASSSLAGGVSGAFTWAIIYHFDVIKTRIQTCPLNTPIEKRRIHYVAQQILNDHGWRYFFRGLGVTLLRAFPVNAIIFPTYEFTLMQLTDYGIGAPAPTVNESAI